MLDKMITRCSVLVLIMEIEVFIDLLLPMERCCEPGAGCQMVGFCEGVFTFFEIFQPNTINKERMPTKLTYAVVGMSVESGNNTPKRHPGDFAT
jgi:hypothetical protein